MKKILYILIVLAALGIFVLSRTVELVYVHPRVNTEVLPYISETIKYLDNHIDEAARACVRAGYGMKVVFKNAYGSGFLKDNNIPNDLDYAVGVHLGKYKYDGTNAREIAANINEKMDLFRVQFYSGIGDGFFSDFSIINELGQQNSKQARSVQMLAQSLPNVFNNKDYVFYSEKEFENNLKIDIPFVLKSNEVLIEDSAPIELYSDSVRYNKDMAKFLREITIVPDFSFDLENTVTGETKYVEIVAESFVGQRLQLSRRFFVPIVFSGRNSADYLKNLYFLNDDEEYIKYRLFNYKRLIQELSNLSELNERPVKMLKRILQCTDLIEPALDKGVADDIRLTVRRNLENPEIIALNTDTTVLGNLVQIASKPVLYDAATKAGEIDRMLNLLEPDERQVVSGKSYTELLSYMEKREPVMTERYNKAMKDKEKLLSYMNCFNEVLEAAGFHKIDIYWLKRGKVGVLRDDFTVTIDDLHKMALDNDLVDVDYVLIDKRDTKNVYARHSVWVRYNPTPQQEAAWNDLRTKLLEDKKNFKIKFFFCIARGLHNSAAKTQ